jgi:putative hydrolase of the HAD superfamily
MKTIRYLYGQSFLPVSGNSAGMFSTTRLCMIRSCEKIMTKEFQPGPNGKILIRGVIFDYGKVLCQPQQPSDLESMARAAGMPIPHFQELYWKFRMRYDRAELNADSYWNSVAQRDGRVFSRQEIVTLAKLDTASWSRPNAATFRWVEELHRAGLRLAVLSNMPQELSDYLRSHCDWLRLFDPLIFSCEVAHVKPEPAIYQACLAGLRLEAEEVLFLDDLAANVEGAAKMGIHSVVFDTVEQTRTRVTDRFDLRPADAG